MPPPSSPQEKPLSIAILGTGNIGSTLAFHLSQSNHKVTTIARPNSTRLSQLTPTNSIITTTGGKALITPTSSLDPTVHYDFLIITLLAHQLTPPLLSLLSLNPTTQILCLFNTFTPEYILNALPTKDVSFGMPFFQARLNEKGELKANVSGWGTQPTILSSQDLVHLFNSCGLPAKFEPNMPLWLRSHAPFCVAFEAIAVIACKRDSGANWNESMIRARGVKACFKLVRALGGEVYPKGKRWVDRMPVWCFAVVLWGLSRVKGFRELLGTGKVECEAILGVMVGKAEGFEGVNIEEIRRMGVESGL